MAGLTFAAVLLFFAVSFGLKNVHKAEDGRPAEALSVPIQQVSRVYVEKAGSLDSNEINDILALIPAAPQYAPHQSDYVKISFNDDVFFENRFDYFKLWINLGVRYPGEYITAFLTHTLWLWNYDTAFRSAATYIETYDKSREGSEDAEFSGAPVMPGLQRYYRYFTESGTADQKLPFLAVFLSPAAPTWVLMLFIAAAVYFKRYGFLFPSFFLSGIWLTVAFSPMMLPRYVLMLYILMPFMICAILQMPDEYVNIKTLENEAGVFKKYFLRIRPNRRSKLKGGYL